MSNYKRRRKRNSGVMPSQIGGKMNVGKVLKEINKVAKKTKILSTALGAIPNPIAQTVGSVAKSVGYGRKKRRRRRMKGRGERLGDSVLGIGYQISNPIFS